MKKGFPDFERKPPNKAIPEVTGKIVNRGAGL